MEGLLAESVPGKKQALPSLVPNCKSEHSPQLLNAIVAVLFIEMDNCLSVSVRIKVMTLFLKLRPQFNEIVDFPVEDNPDTLILVVNWLMPA